MIKSPSETALTIIENIQLYSEEKGKQINRYKCSVTAFLEMSNHRNVVPTDYLALVQAELAQQGWLMMYLPNCEIGFMAMAATVNWTKLSAKRVKPGHETQSKLEQLRDLLKSYESYANISMLRNLYAALSGIDAQELMDKGEPHWFICEILSPHAFRQEDLADMLSGYGVDCEDFSYWGLLFAACASYILWYRAKQN